MKLLELFAGLRSVGKEADKLFFKTVSSDITPFEGIDYCVDILYFFETFGFPVEMFEEEMNGIQREKLKNIIYGEFWKWGQIKSNFKKLGPIAQKPINETLIF